MTSATDPAPEQAGSVPATVEAAAEPEPADDRRPGRTSRSHLHPKHGTAWAVGVAVIAVAAAGAVYRHAWQWGDFPTWVLAVGAVATTWYAVRAYRLQSQEIAELRIDRSDQRALNRQQVELLQLQAADLRESLESRRAAVGQDTGHVAAPAPARDAQARRVFAWQEHLPADPRIRRLGNPKPVVAVHVQNSSDDLIRDVEVRWHRGSAPTAEPDRISQLIPGTEDTVIREVPLDTISEMFGAAVAFRDVHNLTWLRRADDGELLLWPPDQ